MDITSNNGRRNSGFSHFPHCNMFHRCRSFHSHDVYTLSPGLNQELDLPPLERGVQVLQVEPGSPAARLRLQPGDRIVSIGDRAIDDVDGLERSLNQAWDQLRIEIERDGRRLSVVLG